MPKPISHTSGQKGEALALQFLEEAGYSIVARNYRHGRAEVDIIACRQQTLVFVEVKTRSSDAFGHPEEFVHAQQAARIIQAAGHYIETTGWEGQLRFDIIAVMPGNPPVLEHFEDAFY